MRYRHFEVEAVTVNIGGPVNGIDPSRPQGPDVYEEIKQAPWRHRVLFFRDQALSPDSHVALAGTLVEMENVPPSTTRWPTVSRISAMCGG